ILFNFLNNYCQFVKNILLLIVTKNCKFRILIKIIWEEIIMVRLNIVKLNTKLNHHHHHRLKGL
ncbi:hypothetical protein, partial [Clostridioides difficile]|uniref:hypothetical protein n=1 Tax=Clostridioides difficile TaxID=1496 RepID=UPI001A9167EE